MAHWIPENYQSSHEWVRSVEKIPLKVDVLVGSSRAKSVQSQLINSHPDPSNLYIHSRSSAKLYDLSGEAMDLIHRNNIDTYNNDVKVFYLAGYCDLTDVLRDVNYEEVVFLEDIDHAVERVKSNIDQAASFTANYNVTSVFSTIPPANIEIWNTTRYNQRKTNHLSYHSHYQEMNHNIVQALVQLNKYILQKNIENSASTPFVASTMVDNHPGYDRYGRRYPPRVHYSRLVDGVHPTEKLAKNWAKALTKAIKQNRGLLPHKAQQQTSPGPLNPELLNDSFDLHNIKSQDTIKEEAVRAALH